MATRSRRPACPAKSARRRAVENGPASMCPAPSALNFAGHTAPRAWSTSSAASAATIPTAPSRPISITPGRRVACTARSALALVAPLVLDAAAGPSSCIVLLQEHIEEGMIDVRHKHCMHPGCPKQATCNSPGSGGGMYCGQHKLEVCLGLRPDVSQHALLYNCFKWHRC